MKNKGFGVFALAVGLVALAAPLFAHHAQTLYDRESSVTVEGTVTKMEWTNPHIFLFFDVKDEKGNIENWGTEFSSPVTLRRNYGWSKDTFKPGDRITVTGNPRKDGTRMLWGQRGGDNGVPGIKKLN
jgi:hypothetical protein